MNFTITVLWIVYPSHPLRAFPVMFCTVNEEFAMSRDGSWRCIHAWEQRVPVIWPLVRLKTRQTRKFCPHRCRGNAPSMGTWARRKFCRGNRATVGPHIVLSEHADWAIKSLVEASFGEIRETESSLLSPRRVWNCALSSLDRGIKATKKS